MTKGTRYYTALNSDALNEVVIDCFHKSTTDAYYPAVHKIELNKIQKGFNVKLGGEIWAVIHASSGIYYDVRYMDALTGTNVTASHNFRIRDDADEDAYKKGAVKELTYFMSFVDKLCHLTTMIKEDPDGDDGIRFREETIAAIEEFAARTNPDDSVMIFE